MTTIQNKIDSTKNAIGNVLHHHRCAFVNVRALQSIRDERLAQMKFHLQNHPAPEILSIPNSSAHPFAFARSEEAHSYSSILATLATWETAPEFLEAEKIIQPLLDELARLQAELAAENKAAAEAAQRRRDAIEQATAEALAAVNARFAEPEPAPTPPPAPFRGKNLKPAMA